MIPTNLLTWGLAILPILTLLVLMMGFKWGATEAAPIGLLITLLSGLFVYKADLKLIALESAKGVWSSVSILLIILTAILMYQIGCEVKAFSVIKTGMRKLLPNELLLVLAMGWIFESFLQGITGFGVPVAVGAPLLIGIGVNPIWAVIIPLFGQAWGNTFGTLAAAWDALMLSANIAKGTDLYLLTAFYSGAFLFVWNFITGISITWFYGGFKAIKKGLLAVIILSFIQGGGELVLGQLNTTLANFIPATVSMLVILFMGKMKMYSSEWKLLESPIMNRSLDKEEDKEEVKMNLFEAFMPYIILSLLTLLVLLIKPLNTLLSKVQIGFDFPKTMTAYGFVNEAKTKYYPLKIFTDASMFLFISSFVGLIYYLKKSYLKVDRIKSIIDKSLKMTIPSGIAVIGLVIMSKIMSGTGQTIVLSNGIANVLGKNYMILSPFVGLLGTFMTGSNVSSNLLFGDFQFQISKLLSVNPAPVLGAQTTGAAIGSAISPSKIILGTTTAGILGTEGKVMKKIIVITLPVVIGIGLFVYLLLAL